jgi:hypothetical protein
MVKPYSPPSLVIGTFLSLRVAFISLCRASVVYRTCPPKKVLFQFDRWDGIRDGDEKKVAS